MQLELKPDDYYFYSDEETFPDFATSAENILYPIR